MVTWGRMRRVTWPFVALLMSFAALDLSPADRRVLHAAQPAPPIGPSARWVPDLDAVSAARDACEPASAASALACIADQFSRQGAPADALLFTERLSKVNNGEPGFMRVFRDIGRVSIAYVMYPQRAGVPGRADDLYGYWLVNGTPDLIDVDDRGVLPLQHLNRDAVYRSLRARYHDVLIAPMNREDTTQPDSTRTIGGGQRITVSYRVLDGCKSCQVVGIARFAFDFDADGAFKGAALVSVTDRVPGDTPSIPPRIGPAATNPARALNVQVGETFTLTLDANRDGSSWRLARQLDSTILTLVDEKAHRTDGTNAGRDVRNVWVFKAVGPGVTEIPFEYAARTGPPERRMTYTVVVR